MNRLRIIFLSLLVLAGVAGALPVTESLAKWSRNVASRHHRRHRRHSRAWWRRHRRLMRRRRAAALRRAARLHTLTAQGQAPASQNPAAAAAEAHALLTPGLQPLTLPNLTGRAGTPALAVKALPATGG